MFESVAAVERGGALIFGLGFKAIATCRNASLDEFEKLGAESPSAVFFFDVYFLDPDDSAARLLRVGVGKDAVAEDFLILLKYESVTVRRAREEKIEG